MKRAQARRERRIAWACYSAMCIFSHSFLSGFIQCKIYCFWLINVYILGDRPFNKLLLSNRIRTVGIILVWKDRAWLKSRTTLSEREMNLFPQGVGEVVWIHQDEEKRTLEWYHNPIKEITHVFYFQYWSVSTKILPQWENKRKFSCDYSYPFTIVAETSNLVSDMRKETIISSDSCSFLASASRGHLVVYLSLRSLGLLSSTQDHLFSSRNAS